jgi:ribosomal protein S12 methylthiotransferase
MEDNVPEEVKQERADIIMELQQGISESLNSAKVGKTFKVLFDRKEGGYFVGRTEHDSPEVDNEVLVDATNQYIRIGDFAQVKVTSTTEFDLFGEIA